MSKVLLVLGIIACSNVFADVPPSQVKEVDHLVSYIKNSGCIVNRNGTDYPADEGIEHILRKYDYFREDINNTEEFIELSATKSTMSGNYYTVTCEGGVAIKTRDWLLAELARFRQAQKLPAVDKSK
jgi:hypothetical protein